MNYRHAYHAGNFADVLKHVVLVRVLEHLKRKEKPFRVIDTHAGAGAYDLGSDEAMRTGEWRGGIGRVLDATFSAPAAALLSPYLNAVRSLNSGRFNTYPGSPTLARLMMRPQDRLLAIEKHPAEATTLRQRFSGDIQVRVLELDGWLSLGAHVPPKERRGLVLVDPPFEQEGEWERLVGGLARGWRRWPGGTYALWYPVKDRAAVGAFRRALAATGIPAMLDISMTIRTPSPESRLDGSGMIVVNPPFTLEDEMLRLLPELTQAMAEDAGAAFRLQRLTPERMEP